MTDLEVRRKRIAEAATAHFLTEGFDGASLDMIAATAKVGKQAIYECFASKDELFAHVVSAEARRNAITALPDEGDVQATFEAYAADIARLFRAPRNFGLMRANLFATRRFPHLASSMHRGRRADSQPLAAYIERLVSDGRIPPQPSSSLDLATRLGSLTTGGSRYFLGYDLPPPGALQSETSMAVEIFLHGYNGKESQTVHQEPEVKRDGATPGLGARSRLKSERLSSLCDCAADEFLARGFSGSSLAPIIAASGVGRATIYRQFGSKEGLFRYVIGREIAQIRAANLAPPAHGDPQERLAKLARTGLDLHLEARSLALHHLLIEDARTFPELARSFYDAQVDRLGRPLAMLLAERGLARPGLTELRMFHTLATFGLRYVAMNDPVDDAERNHVSQDTARLMVGGLLGF